VNKKAAGKTGKAVKAGGCPPLTEEEEYSLWLAKEEAKEAKHKKLSPIEIKRREKEKAALLEGLARKRAARKAGMRAEGVPSPQYDKLAKLGFNPDEKGRVWCGTPKSGHQGFIPCSSVFFVPRQGNLVPIFLNQSVDELNRVSRFRTSQPKKHTPKAPSLWDAENGRPSLDFLIVDSIHKNPEEEWGRDELARIVADAIARLDPAPVQRIISSIEALTEKSAKKSKPDKQGKRRVAVLESFQSLCWELRHPPTKEQLRNRAGLKVEGVKKGTWKNMDDRQFTREFINPLGLHWLPEADKNRR
jgi:hypothetical protein